MFCTECGHRWAADEIASARFCAECGAPREDLPPLAPAAAAASSYALPPSGPPLSTLTPTFVVPTFAPPSPAAGAGVACAQCNVPFIDQDAAFCGECGHPRPSPPPVGGASAVEATDDDGDLFGTASTTYAASPPSAFVAPSQPPPSTYAASPYPPAPANDWSHSSYGPPSTYAENPYPPAPVNDWSHSSFGPPSASVGFDPPHASFAPPAPATSFQQYAVQPSPSYVPYAEPSASPDAFSTDPNSPPASLEFNTMPPSSVTNISSLLATLSVSARPEEREEPSGNGAGVSIRRVTRARNMDSLSTRLEISNAVERNKSDPTERMEGYNVTRVGDTITVVRSEQLVAEEERYYDARSFPDNGEWLQVLRRNRQSGSKFTDPQFPPDASSLYRDVTNKKYPHLEDHIWKWKRVSDFFNETAYVEVTMLDDAKKLVCSMAIKSPAEAESILQVIRETGASVDTSFLHLAQEAVTTGLNKRKRDHLLLLTKNMITHLSEYVQDGLQRFDLMWEKSLLDHYKPLAFAGVGSGVGYRVDGSDAGVVSRVSVLVPVYFQAQGTCVFDRSREDGAASRVSGVGISSGDLKVGRLADSYLFGALSVLSTSPNALAQLFPELDADLVLPDRVEVSSPYPREQQYNDEGVYAVRFWRNHRSRVVVIDDYIPCSQYGKPVFGSFTGTNGKFEIWSLLVEKAYAKLHGGYEAIIGGQEAYCLQDLYGGVPSSFKLQETFPTEDAAWDGMNKALHAGSLVGCSNDDVEMDLPKGLRKSFAYGVMTLAELDYKGEYMRVVQLRNSWGVGTHSQPDKWSGAWSSADPKWHSLSRSQKVELGFQFREDQTYWMDFSAFYCFFSTVIESRNLYNFRSVPDGLGNPVSPSLSIHVIAGQWSGITSGGREAMHLNPQYQLFSPATQGCDLLVHLEQPSRRMKLLNEYQSYIAPVVLKNGERMQRKIDLSHDVVATGTFISNRSCFLETSLDCPGLEPGKPFVVTPATYDGRLPYTLEFSLTLFTTKPTAVVPVSDTSSLPVCVVCQRALSGTFRTFTHVDEGGQTHVDRVCKDTCVDVYRERNTPVCVDCRERIEVVDGRFSGRMYTLPDGATVHAECIDAYQIRVAEKCVQCGHAIAAIPGRFDGKYYEITGGKVHGECMEAFQLSTAKRCVQCSEPVVKLAGRFDGRFYKIDGDQLVHFECWDTYQLAVSPKCVHCREPVVQIPGRFDGRFYELTTGVGKVHFECWESYQRVAK